MLIYKILTTEQWNDLRKKYLDSNGGATLQLLADVDETSKLRMR